MALHFVTGSSGFLGGQIVSRLRGMGEDVIGYDILPSRDVVAGVRFIQGDVLDRSALRAAMHDVEYVHHNAALVPLTKAGPRFHEVNALGTRRVLDVCRELDVKKVVHMSSSAIYGVPRDCPVMDETPYHPIEIYGRSKLAGEEEVWRYMDEGHAAACIRPRTIIGGTNRLGIFQILFEWIARGKRVYVIGDGSNLFQFVHVDDLIDASVKAAFVSGSGKYNIGAEVYRTLREDLEALIRHAGTASRVTSLPVWLAKGSLYMADVLRLSPLAPWHYLTYHKPFVFDISRAKQELGWQPKFSNEQALIESYEWYLAHREETRTHGSAHTKPVQQRLLKVLSWFS